MTAVGLAPASGASRDEQSILCCVCRRDLALSWYVLSDGTRCAGHALCHAPTLRRSLRVALLVGTILFLINQADVVFSGHVTTGVVAKVALTYAVPFCVATYGALSGARRRTTMPRGRDSRRLGRARSCAAASASSSAPGGASPTSASAPPR